MHASRHATLIAAITAGAAWANPVEGLYFDVNLCDNHGPLDAVEELGIGFPPDELIIADSTFWDGPACPMTDDPNIPNTLVVMTNLSDRYWDNLFYVGDHRDTGFSNVDGLGIDFADPGMREGLAFRIDSFGDNRPLIFESITFDGIFEPGETWHFIVQDYGNVFGLPPSALTSFGFAGASSGDGLSSASIVQFVPAPGTLALLGLGGGLLWRRRP